MSAELLEAEQCEVSLEEAAAEFERLLADARFRISDRQREILRYLAERRFAGCREGVKAYAVALDVLGRPSGFDAAMDPIVRIEMSRLRTTLDNYYALFASELGLSIQIPKGSYVTLFPRQFAIPKLHDDPGRETELSAEEVSFMVPDNLPPSFSGGTKIHRVYDICVGAMAALCIAIVGIYASMPKTVGKPVVRITMFSAVPDMAEEASLTRDMLLTALSNFQTVVVRRPEVSEKETGHGYEIELKYAGDGDARTIWWQVIDADNGDLLKSGLEKIEVDAKSPADMREEFAGKLAKTFVATRGVVNTLEMQEYAKGTLGNPCVLRAEYALNEGRARDVSDAAACLKQTLSNSPDDPDATALLARTLLAASHGASDRGMAARSMDLARRAVSTAPRSDRAQLALMAAQFAAGRMEAAIQAGERAVTLNPNNSEASSALGLVLYASGDWQAGVDLARKAEESADAPPRDAMLVLALDAYRHGRWTEASVLAEQVTYSDFMVQALSAAALGQLGSNDAGARLEDVVGDDPDFERSFRLNMDATRMGPQIAAQIEVGLTKAGANFAGGAAGLP